MRTLIRYNSLYFFFMATQMLVVLLGMQQDKIIGEHVRISNAIIYHFVGLFFFTLGYIPLSKKKFIDYNKIVKKHVAISRKYFFFGYSLCIVGIITSVATIGSVVSPAEYLQLLFSGGSNLMDIRYESGAEGLTGIFKMMNYFPLGVFLISNAFSSFFELSAQTRKHLNKLIIFSVVGCIVKVFFSLDRLTLLAIILVYIYQNFLVKKVKIKYILYIALVMVFLAFITSSRMKDSGVLGFLITYFKLALVNYELVIEHQKENSYGFSTFLMPFWFVLKFFSVDYKIPEPEVWIWNPAQYFASYLYIDFGVFSLLLFFILGLLIRKIQLKTLQGSIRYSSIYFIVLFVLVTFTTVPIIRGTELWLIISLALFLSKAVNSADGRKTKIKNRVSFGRSINKDACGNEK